MAFRAVAFDLFGTLVDNTSFVGHPSAEWRAVLTRMAAEVGADPGEFTAQWAVGTPARTRGDFETVEACVRHVCAQLKLKPRVAHLRAAAALRIDYMRRGLAPRPDALPTLSTLRAKGIRTGVVSNCIPDVPLLWADTPFAPLIDEPVFSARERLAKPDPQIFRLACDRLGVAPDACLFVADGEGGELTAAASIGMTAILIRSSYADPPQHRRPHVEAWTGPTITWLNEVTYIAQ